MSASNSLIRHTDVTADLELTQNPCYLGIHVTTLNPSSTQMDGNAQQSTNGSDNTIKCHCVTIHPISSKISYVEWLDSPSLLVFRSLLLQEQPTNAVLFTSHGLDPKANASVLAKAGKDGQNSYTKNEAEPKVLDSIENELILSNCPVTRTPFLKEWTDHQNIKTILAYILSPFQDETISDSSHASTTDLTASKQPQARSIYSHDTIQQSFTLCQNLLNSTSLELQYNSTVMIGLVYKILNQFITTPIKEQAVVELQLGSSTSAINRSKLAKLRQESIQLPTKYIFSVTPITTSLRIDQNTLTSLGVLPSPTDAHKTMSLFGLLNNCQTAFGSRLLLTWIKQPLLDIYQINQRQLAVQAFISSQSMITPVRSAMKGVPDIEKILTKLNKTYSQTQSGQRKMTSIVSNEIIKELVNLYFFVGKMKHLLSLLSTITVTMPTEQDTMGGEDTSPVDENDLYQFTTLYTEYPPETPDGEPLQVSYTISTLQHDKLLLSSLAMSPQQYTNIRYTRELQKLLDSLQTFEHLIQSTIDFDALARHEFLIKSEISPALADVSKRKGKIFRALERLHAEVMEELGCDEKTVKMQHTSANDIGYFLRVTRRDEKLIRDKSSIYQVLESRKDGVRFTTTNFKKLSQEYQDQIDQYQSIQYETCVQLLDTAMTYCNDFHLLMGLISEVDVLLSFAHTATLSQKAYIRPQLISPQTLVSIGPQFIQPPQHSTPGATAKKDVGQIRLINARHPCLEVQPGVQYIPNDVDIQHGTSELQLITGPNMGGKSSYLRSAALVVLMAQIGSFVPCDEASIYLVDCILARVGAGDVQLKGISTFMKEMIETSEILNYATSNSLIIIDELGRGTSTYDGFGLAWGIAEYLTTQIHGYTLFATHFHEMTSMVNELPTVKNKHVTAHTGNNAITMLYKIQDGFCDRSFGIHVAEMANFPPQVITIARQKANELEDYANANTVQLAVPREKPLDNADAALASSTSASSSNWQSKLGEMDDTTETMTDHPPMTITGANQVELALVKLPEQKALDCIESIFKDPKLHGLMATLEGLPTENQNWSIDQISMAIPAYNAAVSTIAK